MTRSSLATLASCAAGGTLLVLAASAPTPTHPAAASQEAPQEMLPFAEVQHELFAVPNSYADAWGDFDDDGHHTRFGAEIRLYDPSGRILASRPVVTGG